MAICVRRSFAVFAFSFLTLASDPVLGQGAKILSKHEPASDADSDRPGQREQWFMHGRTVPGQSAAALRYRAHVQKMQLRAAHLTEQVRGSRIASEALAAITTWTPLGPSPLASDATGFGGQDYNWVSGRATAVALDPADPTGNTVYLGGAYGGVWKSIDAGRLSPNPSSVTWIPISDNQATLAVGSIAIQPGNADPTKSVILVGTGETNSSSDSYYGLGILRSADAGVSWTLISQDRTGRQFAGMGFSKIAFSTLTPGLVVAAAAGSSQGITEGLENPVAMNRGLYYATDGGQSWNYASIKDVNVTIDPSSATSVVYNAAAGEFFAALRYHGIYSSSDGISWTRLANQPGGLSTFVCPANPGSSGCPIYRGELAVVPGRNQMYVWYVDGSATDQGIWQTTDGGISWTELSNAGITNCGDSFGGCGTAQGIYNLELAAVPNGTATDLYAGAVNLYKCTLTSLSPSCSGTGSNTFLNLTHVYGCPPNFGSIAHVHPDQHGVAFMQVNGNTQVVMYFANDGGIYRTLDGYSGLTTGNCGGSNQFDSLNQTLGSMTQFVSFSQHPTDPNTILGGTQDNGSPAMAWSQSGTGWLNVNSGDSGYNAINPNNPTEWFTANTGVSIQRCTSGIACHAQDFTEVVSSATVGGDFGAFYTPYILDPQNSGELIVGTCRVWRGTSSGTGFTVLSDDFETGGSGSCNGSEVNLVRWLAAGGTKDSNGSSNVIYAGTDGFGPLLPTGGHIWVTANASVGPGSWLDRTSSINPGGFPVSGIALDSSDKTGNIAYVTIMGFHVSHVWKTSDAGASWTDFTGNLPDAPANAILVDASSSPATGTVYVATDVGVFSTATPSANWVEVGPAPNPLDGQQSGYLPNVAVTALQLFNAGGTKKLRASTYGRGMWEFTLIAAPDFEFAFSNNPLTMFAGQPAAFSGTLLALSGYNSNVNLGCSAGVTPAPLVCSVPQTPLLPTSAGAPFTVNASSPVAGDYLFNAQGVGTDPNTVTRDFLLTLHVVDFNLTAPSPSNVTVSQSGTSTPVSFQVTAAGAFNAAVALSCTGLPSGATCNFQPSSSVNPTAASPVAVTMTVSASASTTAGNFTIVISGSATGGPNKTQSLALIVTTSTSSADYTLAISNPSQTAPVTGAGTFNGTLTTDSGYGSVVNLSCGTGAPLTCTASPASVIPSASGATFTITAGSDVVQSYNFSIVATGSDPAHTTHSKPVVLDVVFDFAVNNQSGPQTIAAGQKAHYALDVRPLGNGTNFPGNVGLSCSGLPPLSTCSFSPTQVPSGSGDTNVGLDIQTTAAVPHSARIAQMSGAVLFWAWLPLPGLVLAYGGLRRSLRKRLVMFLLPSVIVLLAGLQVACGGGVSGGGAGQPGTPPGNYTIIVNATSGSLNHNVPVILTVTP